ncbi:hypothetical protein C8R45DRAFT_1107952 [Mycena sanguinolenta]|nr:hypothetical protein C8R45DRAFT_1107952 [Mycena sanguinolenta]
MPAEITFKFRHSYFLCSAARTEHPLAFPFAASFHPRRARGAVLGAAPMNAASFSYDEGQPLPHQHAIPLDDPDARGVSPQRAIVPGLLELVHKSTILGICVHDSFVASAGSNRCAAVLDLAPDALVKIIADEDSVLGPEHGRRRSTARLQSRLPPPSALATRGVSASRSALGLTNHLNLNLILFLFALVAPLSTFALLIASLRYMACTLSCFFIDVPSRFVLSRRLAVSALLDCIDDEMDICPQDLALE